MKLRDNINMDIVEIGCEIHIYIVIFSITGFETPGSTTTVLADWSVSHTSLVT
jgi:hypothetical protein